MSASRSAARPFQCIRVPADEARRERAEWAAAEAFAAGATGVEECVEDGRVTFAIYAPEPAVEPVRAALALAGVEVLSVSPVASQDWSEAWKEDLEAILVSPRLAVRPSCVALPEEPGRRVLEIDPGQAFGTGAHESTRLALEGVDALAGTLGETDVLLDVGTGTGVLALAALALGCGRALGLDLDPLAAQACRENAERNGLAERLPVFVGGVEALHPQRRFAAIAANLLWSELAPVLPAIAQLLVPDGHAVFSGLLESQAPELVAAAGSHGLREERRLRRVDASDVTWVALVMIRETAAPRR